MLNLPLYSNTDWTLQRRRVTACEDFLKLIEKIKHFPIFNHIPFSGLSHLHYLPPPHSIWSFKLRVLNSPLSQFVGGVGEKVCQLFRCQLNGVKRSCPAQLSLPYEAVMLALRSDPT